MNRENIDRWFIDTVMASPDMYLEDFKQASQTVAKSNAVYKGKPCPFLYMPKFYTTEDLNSFKSMVNKMMAICQKMITLYIEHPHIRKKYNFSPRLEKLILKQTLYKSNVPMARFDIFYYGVDDFKFCEINTDGTSAMNEDMVLADILSKTKIMREMTHKYNLSSFELFDTWVDALQDIYTEATNRQDKPVVAIVDFMDKSSKIEFEEFQLRFKNKGCEVYIVDPRDLIYNKGLYYNNQKIDVVYRRLVTRDMMERIDEIPAFEQACLDDTTVIIGNIRSQVVHTKLFFKMLFDSDVRQYFNNEEQSFIDRHIPKTMDLKEVSSDLEYYVKNREHYILKPLDHYASIGVYAGSEYSDEEWKSLLIKNLEKPYLLQAFCKTSNSDNINQVDGALKVDTYRNITGVFVYNQTVQGIYSRAGKTAIISGLHDVYTLPTFLVK